MSNNSLEEMDRQLNIPSVKPNTSFEQNSVPFSSSLSLNQNRNNNRNFQTSTNNNINYRNQNQNRLAHVTINQRSSNATTNSNTSRNNCRNNLSERFNRHQNVAQNNSIKLKVSPKERFVQANCQFVMKSSFHGYGSHLKDPDLPIDWDNVEEVIFTNSGEDQVCCPICLSDPIAAKITRCGHIYCWSCVLHYLALSDDKYRPCPICYEKVRKNELKSATILQKVAYKKSDVMNFCLMKIDKGSTVAIPANYDVPNDVSMNRLRRNGDDILNQVCKYFVSTPTYLEELIIREETELFRQKLEYQQEGMPEVCFVDEALSALDCRKDDLLHLEELSKELTLILDNEQRLSPRNAHINDWIYFYLSDDRQPIFLHSLNVRMLKHEFGELKNCPQTLSAQIIEILGASVNEHIRRKNAHFRHLPLTCELKIAEVEFTNHLLSQTTLDHFSKEIVQRTLDRRRKAKEQQRRDRRIDIENHRKIFGVPTRGPSFDFNDVSEFPTWNDFSFSPERSSNQSYPVLSASQSIEPAVPTIINPGGSSSNPPKKFQSSFASLLHGNNSSFQASTSLRKGSICSATDSPRVLEGANHVVTSMDMSMSDFLENCIKRGKPKKNKKGRKGSD